MAQIRNTSGGDLFVPPLGDRLVMAGQVVEVPDADVYGFTQQDAWDAVDEAAKAAHDEATTAYAAVTEQVATGPQEPARSASRAAWEAYVLAATLATPDEIADLTRDELRDTYGNRSDQ